MKVSTKLQNQFADFKAEFAHICREFGGVNDKFENAGSDSAFIIVAPWATIRASIHHPWNTIDGTMHEGWRKSSSAAIYLCADKYESLPEFWKDAGDTRPHWKWNIHRFAPAGGMFVECANECLLELTRRLQTALKVAPLFDLRQDGSRGQDLNTAPAERERFVSRNFHVAWHWSGILREVLRKGTI